MSLKIKFASIFLVVFLYGCPPELTYFPTILDKLESSYIQLPEQAISISRDNAVFAQYTNPSEKYGHGILGDKIEAQQLVVVVDSVFHELRLEDEFVFEDIRPRLFDVDSDGILEFITIKTSITEGAGIAIYKLVDGELIEFAYVQEIGSSNRWLNIVAIEDLDKDGIIELAWIETPHIGGILKIAKIQAGLLTPIAEVNGYSNHAIGQTNLCLSAVSEQNGENIVYVPSQDRNKIIGFKFNESTLQIHDEIDFTVDFSQSLKSQYAFTELLIEKEDNCIILP